MKIKNPNWLYILALEPLLIADFCLGIWLVQDKLWAVMLLAVFGLATVSAVFRKFREIPKPMDSYKKCRRAFLELPVQANVELFWCDSMADFEFLHRIVEVAMPLFPKGKPFRVMMNPKMLEAHGETFMKVAVTRELESLRTYTSLKSTLGLVLPFEALAFVLLLVARFHAALEASIGGFWVNMAGPALAVAFFGLSLYLWNRQISKDDIRLDCYLLAHFSKEEIKEYICITEKMLGGGEKRKEFSEHYMNDRLFALQYYKK